MTTYMPAATTYRDAHPLYRSAGWTGPLPLTDGTKWPPPEGWTGWHGAYPSYADSEAWCDCSEYSDTHQLGLRMADDVIGIDVDHYGEKRGADTIAEAESRWGPLPDGPRSSARGDGPSGIRFFRVPRGTVLRTVIGFRDVDDNGKIRHFGSVEIIQRHHRYAVVWPSVHPTGATYLWYGTDRPDAPPRVADLPALPQAWIVALASHGEPGEAEATPEQVKAFALAHSAGDRSASLNGPVAIFRRDVQTGLARHDAMLNAACMAAREARAGAYPAGEACRALRDEFVLALAEAKPGQRLATPAESRREFASIWGWAVGQALAMSIEQCRARIKREAPKDEPRAEQDEDGEPVDTGMRYADLDIDLSAYLDGEVELQPTDRGLCRADGIPLLYAGLTHMAVGETEAGKSWLALACAMAEMRAGRRVLYVHFEESDPRGTVLRLRQMGARREWFAAGLFRFAGIELPLAPDRVANLVEHAPDLAILDGVNAAMALHGMNPDKADEYGKWDQRLARPLAATGAATLSLDHVVKNPEAAQRGYAGGTVMKLNLISGASFLLENCDPLRPGAKGRSSVYVAKDRPGSLRAVGEVRSGRRALLGSFWVDSTSPLTICSWTVPAPEDKADEEEPGKVSREAILLLRALTAMVDAPGRDSGKMPTANELRTKAGPLGFRTSGPIVSGLLTTLEGHGLVANTVTRGAGRWEPTRKGRKATLPPGVIDPEDL